LAVSRLILKDPPILFFDEATSALDTHTEQALMQNINSIIKEKGRTSVFIAHRLRTIYDCDVIIVLQEGRVAESGTHEQLINRGGLYSELWSGKCFSAIHEIWANVISHSPRVSLCGEAPGRGYRGRCAEVIIEYLDYQIKENLQFTSLNPYETSLVLRKRCLTAQSKNHRAFTVAIRLQLVVGYLRTSRCGIIWFLQYYQWCRQGFIKGMSLAFLIKYTKIWHVHYMLNIWEVSHVSILATYIRHCSHRYCDQAFLHCQFLQET
jgi:hypothetical protein